MYALATRKIPSSDERCRCHSGFLIIKVVVTRNMETMNIRITVSTSNPKYLPNTISRVRIGDEYSSLMLPELTSLFITPIVNNGINRYKLDMRLPNAPEVNSDVRPVPL